MNNKIHKNNDKSDLLKEPVEHFDIKKHNTFELVDAMKNMSFSARDLARAAEIYDQMLKDRDCTVFLAISGSTSAAGCMQIYVDLVQNNMVDAIISTGASIVDMDFFEALGFKHYKGSQFTDDTKLRELYIDRIYDTFIDENELQCCDHTIKEIAENLDSRPYSSREFIYEMGRWLVDNPQKSVKKNSIVQTAYEHDVPIFCPAFSDSSAGLGLIAHYEESPNNHLTIDPVQDFLELTKIKIQAKESGVFMIGGGVPKNFIQDTVIGAEVLGKDVPMHKYSIQITVADQRDGALSGSTLKEAGSWGKVDKNFEQMVFAEATIVLPLIASYVYHSGAWRKRKERKLANILSHI